MKRFVRFALGLSLASGLLLARSGLALAEPTTHVVYPGQTLGRIAKRYNISIQELCEANGMTRRDRLKPGQTLHIPDPNQPSARAAEPERPSPDQRSDAKASTAPAEAPERTASEPRLPGGMHALDLPGGPAYYFEPSGAGRNSMKPVIVYLHGRGGHPADDCRRWAPVARRMGWLVCPSGPEPVGDGRAWNNNWMSAQKAAVGAVQALRDRYGRRVQLWGNTLIGFSEGAYAAMNVGVREPHTFNRWLILAADAKYWGGPGMTSLQEHHGLVRRVYLITGQQDEVVDGTRTAFEWLEKAGIATRMATPEGLGHEVALQRKPGLYRAALQWLAKGGDKDKLDGAVASN